MPTTQQLHAGLASDRRTARAAAFIIGRCQAKDTSADQRLTEAMITAMRSAEFDVVRIEAAMSAVLRNVEPAAAIATLQKFAVNGSKESSEPWRAAAYLAQSGDPSGWPVTAATLSHRVAQYRLYALDTLGSFLPYEGTMVANQLVDVVDRIIGFAEDKDASFRARVPALLLLSQSPDSKEILESLAKDSDIVVQGNAQDALRALRLP